MKNIPSTTVKTSLFTREAFERGSFAFLLFVFVFMFSSCKDDNEGDFKQYLKQGKESRPAWEAEEPNYPEFEQTMSVEVTLQEVLLPYASDEDLMCAMIGDEIRAVNGLERTGGQVYFPLVIAGNSDDNFVTLKYYCSKLRRIYTIERWMPFTPGMAPTLGEKLYVPEFIPGAS